MRPWRHLCEERGATAVEFAIVLVPLLMIIFGIISFGLTFSDSLALENAARESGRFGAAYPVDDAPAVGDAAAGTEVAWLRTVAQVAEGAATGSLNANAANRVLCVAKGSSDEGFARVRIEGAADITAATSEAQSCFTSTAPSGHEVVQIQVQRDGWIETVVFSSSPRLDGRSTTRYER